MKQVQASEAKTHLPSLLDEVERGETLVITRHGRAIARLIPEPRQRQEEVDRAMADIEAIRKQSRPVSEEEVRAWIGEGRK
jgi:prevent-host-death family protein